jgi:hypothetical protein
MEPQIIKYQTLQFKSSSLISLLSLPLKPYFHPAQTQSQSREKWKKKPKLHLATAI